ncbi:MAG: iron chelate uptake ABC transporter family permease subunit, partial [Candidatus Omnitrophota bacterium]|nr:iron chelate uptake ABC transporter family permease subunit [Candidatus Omnitrophota bacterium]
MSNRTMPRAARVMILIGALLLIAAMSLCLGSTALSVKRSLHAIIAGHNTTEYSILFDIRLPRIILGFAIGGALSLAGVILQGLFR